MLQFSDKGNLLKIAVEKKRKKKITILVSFDSIFYPINTLCYEKNHIN